MKRIDIDGYIGGEINNPLNISKKLNESKGEDIIVFINSQGGSFFDGISIYHKLRTYSGNVTTVIGGMCASAGSIIQMAGQKRYALKGSIYQCHMPSTISIGNSKDLLKDTENLQLLNNVLMEIYQDEFKGSKEDLEELLFQDKLISIEDAIDKGFIHKRISANEIKALFKEDENKEEKEDIKNSTNRDIANDNSISNNIDIDEKENTKTLWEILKGEKHE